MSNDPYRFWWLTPIIVFVCGAGVWYFEHITFPRSLGIIGAVVGLLLGAFFAALLEDYFDQNSN
jgi:hypothetical protein